MATFRIIKEKNYTVVTNDILRDKRLTDSATILLIRMLSLPEEWDYTQAGLSITFGTGAKAVASAIKVLEETGYLLRTQTRSEGGRYSKSEYLVFEKSKTLEEIEEIQQKKVQIKQPKQKKQSKQETVKQKQNKNQKSDIQKSDIQKSDIQKSDIQKSDIQKSDIQKSDIQNKYIQNTYNYQSINKPYKSMDRTKKEIDVIDKINEYNTYKEIIKENIGYEVLIADYYNPKTKIKKINNDKDKIDEILEIITMTVCSTKPYIKISNEEIPKELVKNKFLKLEMGHIEYVLNCFNKTTSKINNINAYLLTSLYNSSNTINHYYDNIVKFDLMTAIT
ncbi:MAG: helix-turn-helix domain-containing protein [Defluviitaleaceae bacterium]|nr:helix-turn-helix domain-containing protein [Defluviitaleaceae bacterium]